MTAPQDTDHAPRERYHLLDSEQAAGLRDVLEVLSRFPSDVEQYSRTVAAELPEMKLLLDLDDPEKRARWLERQALLRQACDTGDLSEYLSRIQAVAVELAARGVRFPVLVEVLTRLVPLLHRLLVEAYGDDRARVVRGLNGLHHLTGAILSEAGKVYTEVREDQLEQEYRRVLRELSVPVVPVWHGVLVVPLIGVLDSARARDMTQTLLDTIAKERARVAILDVTGVPTVDTQVADYLIRAVKAARLLGTRGILVGIRPAIAQTLVRLGMDLADVQTEADLQSGLRYAFRLLGYRIVREPQDE